METYGRVGTVTGFEEKKEGVAMIAVHEDLLPVSLHHLIAEGSLTNRLQLIGKLWRHGLGQLHDLHDSGYIHMNLKINDFVWDDKIDYFRIHGFENSLFKQNVHKIEKGDQNEDKIASNNNPYKSPQIARESPQNITKLHDRFGYDISKKPLFKCMEMIDLYSLAAICVDLVMDLVVKQDLRQTVYGDSSWFAFAKFLNIHKIRNNQDFEYIHENISPFIFFEDSSDGRLPICTEF